MGANLLEYDASLQLQLLEQALRVVEWVFGICCILGFLLSLLFTFWSISSLDQTEHKPRSKAEPDEGGIIA